MLMRPFVIAATLIARNEARCLARCLDSLAAWVDRIVVVDTGSTDDTIAIARAKGAVVGRFAWCDDFATARNHALALAEERADADWHLVIDADEWIAAGGASLRPWCAGPARLGRVSVLSDTADAGIVGRCWITRVLPRGARFTGRVHEQVAGALPREPLPLEIGHDGYRVEQLATKATRNHRLLLAELASHPGDAYLLYQLGKDAEMRGDPLAAETYHAQALAATPADAAWRHDLVLCALRRLSANGQPAAALALADAEFAHWQHSPDFFFVLGDVLLAQAIGDPGRAVEHWLPLASGAWERCLAIGERPDLDGSVAGRGSHLARHNLDVVRAQLAMLAA